MQLYLQIWQPNKDSIADALRLRSLSLSFSNLEAYLACALEDAGLIGFSLADLKSF